MKSLHPLLLPFMLVALVSPVFAQDKEKTEKTPKTTAPKFVIPADANGMKSIIAAPEKIRPIKVGIYRGPGAPQGGGDNVANVLKPFPQAQVVILSEKDVATLNLSAYDVLVFPGGSGGGQSKGIGEAGLKNVRDFVRNGGGYVGICGGAYLACSNFSWGLGILNAGTVSSKWMRGQAMLDLEVAPAGTELLGDVKAPFKVRYHNGPILKPGDRTDIPPYTVVSTFKTEVANNGTPAGVQVDSPAHTISTYGKGRVFISSPHPENTPGLENLIPRGIFWAAGEKSSNPIP
ncbi:BPL-N domain-containing protein [Prosthecobacter sp.]|uniref:BPL-N domain-containing protein n=1 Tax=Prosthecobacter sp. TaxID=1965333 RepID=UPI003784F488